MEILQFLRQSLPVSPVFALNWIRDVPVSVEKAIEWFHTSAQSGHFRMWEILAYKYQKFRM